MSTKEKNSFRSGLGKVKGHGSAKDGTHHWLMQRITAIALIPLSLWFVCLVLQSLHLTSEQTLLMVAKPFNSFMAIGFVLVTLYHSQLGMRVIIEDYVNCNIIRNTMLISLSLVTGLTAIAGICAVLYYHVSYYTMGA